jgi:hypothetical protein
MPPAPSSIQCWVEALPSPQRNTTTHQLPPPPCATVQRRRRRIVLGEVASNGAGRGRMTKQKKFMDTTDGLGIRRRGNDVKGRDVGGRVRGGHGHGPGQRQGQRRVSPRRLPMEHADNREETYASGKLPEEDWSPGLQQHSTEEDGHGHEHGHDHDEWVDATPRAARQRRPLIGTRQTLDIPPLPSGWAESLANTGESVDSSPTRSYAPRTARSITSTSSSNTTQSHRSKSPSKTPADLLPAGIAIGKIEAVPADITHLYRRLSDLRDSFAIIPWLVHEKVAQLCPTRTIHKHMLQDRGSSGGGADGDDAWILQKQQLDELLYVMHEAEQCSKEIASESAWNVKVHGPLLRLALCQRPSLCFEVVTHATICPSFLPASHSTGQTQSARIVDFTINLCPGVDPKSEMHRAIVAQVSNQPADTRTVNHTLYGPLRFKPCTTAIETKASSNNSDDGIVQLALWASAHLTRLRRLARNKDDYKAITLPLIRTAGHYWYFLYAVESWDLDEQQQEHAQQRLEIQGEVLIGNTADIVGLYTLLWSLRALAEWSEETFEPWFRREILGLQLG